MTTDTDDDYDTLWPPRLVPDCAASYCDRTATQLMTGGDGEIRLADPVCDEHGLSFARIETRRAPVFIRFALDEMVTLPAHEVQPWMITWSVPGVPEWAEQEWRWLVSSTQTVRDEDGRLRVRWTYQDARVQEFGYYQQVTGWWRIGRPEGV